MDLEEKRKEKCDKINLLDALRKGKRCDQRIGWEWRQRWNKNRVEGGVADIYMIDFHDLAIGRFANKINKMKKNAYVMRTDEMKSKR